MDSVVFREIFQLRLKNLGRHQPTRNENQIDITRPASDIGEADPIGCDKGFLLEIVGQGRCDPGLLAHEQYEGKNSYEKTDGL
jgi:hypothetical protein